MSYQDIIQAFHLRHHDRWFKTYNYAGNLPYHNNFHSECMVINCYEGAQYHNLPYDSTRSLLIAAMFHDFGHTGGEECDTVNIKVAIAGYERFANQTWPNNLVHDCIRTTEYPFRDEYHPFTIEQRIIRDADLMQFKFPNWDEMYFVNLKKEMEVRVGHPISDVEMLEGNRNFWKNVQLFTKWGKESVNQAPGPFRIKMDIVRDWYNT